MPGKEIVLMLLCAMATSLPAADKIPHPEHPRPDLRREQWVNLNGPWAFDFDPGDAGEKAGWFQPDTHRLAKQIVVPFPWESKLSGIERPDYAGVAWYARTVTVPADWKGRRAWLCFGAVDWAAKVWVNGTFVGEHVGGYTPFAFDIADLAAPGQAAHIVVRADDPNSPEQPFGKQTPRWYTHTGGIWQTVHLEARGDAWLDRMQLTTSLADDHSTATVEATTFCGGKLDGIGIEFDVVGQGSVTLSPVGRTSRLALKLAKPRPWSPDDPHLYDAVVRLVRGGKPIDTVHSYVGIRELGVAKAPGRDYKYITLNGKPVYLRGALHQSFHPDGIYQYPDDATLRWDYEYAKKIGLNFLRIHIKTEIPRALYWADKLGVLIMEDQPSFGRYTERSKQWWDRVLRETVARDFNHPSIFAWCNFNETWGIGDGGYTPEHQAWVKQMYELTKRLDPTRLVEDNSPCRYDHVVTDINSWHFYINDYRRAKGHIADVVNRTFPGSPFNYAKGLTQDDAPLINSEYGGISAGLGDQDISWCFKYLTNELRKHDKVCGYVYTEQSDIEWEHNGFLNYDRSEKLYGYDFWFKGFSLADLNAPDFVVLDAEPCPAVKPGATLSVPVLVSHWSARTDTDLTLHWRLDVIDRWGTRHDKVIRGSRKAHWEPYRVTSAGTIDVPMPTDGPAVGALCVWLADADGKRVAANYVNVHVDAPTARVEARGSRQVALRFAPNAFAAWKWAGGTLPTVDRQARQKLFAHGTGYVEYELAIPDNVPTDSITSLAVIVEAAAKADDEKLAWPARKKPVDYPQTDKDVQWPTDLAVSVNGVTLGQVTLADDPADSRGVLSHQYRHHPGSFGWLVRMQLDGARHKEALDAIRRTRKLVVRFQVPANAQHRGGLAIFGDRLGRYAIDPTVMLSYDRDHGLARAYRAQDAVAVNRLLGSTEVALPTAEQFPAAWRYTTDKPADNWAAPDFNDAGWKTGRGGFGRKGTPNAVIHTAWHEADIWLRTRFDLVEPGRVAGAILRVYHDEDVEIYLNGQQVATRSGYVVNYVEHALSPEHVKLLKDKDNVLAVHCRQTRGGQNIDVGLSVLRKSK